MRVGHAGLLFATFVCVSLTACVDRGRITEGYRLMSVGQYEAALEQFQRAERGGRESPDLQAGLGLVLSLERASSFAAVDLLVRSLKQRDNEAVRRELVILYMTLGVPERATQLLDPDQLPTERFFAPEINVMRNGARCFRDPSEFSIKQIRQMPDHPLRDYFAALCYLSPAWGKEHFEAAVLAVDALKDERLKCEGWSMFPDRLKATSPGLEARQASCLQRFPDNIVVHRRFRPAAIEVKAVNRLFDTSAFKDEDPGMEPVFSARPATEGALERSEAIPPL